MISMNYKQELPTDAEAALDAYIDRIKKIRWFKPAADIKRENVDTAIKAAISAFGVEASIEYRNLKTPADWDAARDAAWGAAWDAARGAAWGAARDAIAALVTWDSSADLLDCTPDVLRTMIDLAEPPVCHQAALLLPSAIVRSNAKQEVT